MDPVAKRRSSSIRALLLQKGWSRHDLAAKAGLDAKTVSTEISGWGVSGLARRKIEAALRIPFWTGADTFAKRLPGIVLYGVDIEVAKMAQLQELVAAHVPTEGRPALGPRQTPSQRLLTLLRWHLTQQEHSHAAPAAPSHA